MSSHEGSLAFAAAYLMASVLSVVVAVLAWRCRRVTYAATGLSVIMIAMTIWSVGDVFLALAQAGWISVGVARIGFTPIIPMGAVTAAGLWLTNTALADPLWRPRGRTLALLALAPGCALTAALTDHWTGLISSSFRMDPVARQLVWQTGPLFWPHVLVSYSLVLGSSLILVRAWSQMGRLHRRQASMMLAGAILPMLANVTGLLGWAPWLPLDLTPVSFAVVGAAALHEMTRKGLLRLAPLARGLVLDRLRDAVIVMSPEGLMLDVNKAAHKLINDVAPGLPAALTGVPFQALLHTAGASGPLTDGVYRVDLPGGQAVLDVDVELLADERGRLVGQVVVIRDITELDQLRQCLANQAIHDELTGLHNRRYLLSELDRELDLALRGRHDLCVIMLDIDNFKSVNDQYGHGVGDTLLVGIAEALAQRLRAGDVLARQGGEEFVVLLPGASKQQGMERAERLRRACSEVVVQDGDARVNRTISAGVASVRELTDKLGPLTTTSVLQQADSALYAAKRAGRNRVMAAQSI
jgi:diguanylate cyclase (GGDEF)-like protein